MTVNNKRAGPLLSSIGGGAMKRLAFLAAVGCMWGCALTGTGRAGPIVVYSTFGEPGDTFSNGGADTVEGSQSFGLQYDAFAAAFTPSASVQLTSIRFAFSSGMGIVLDAVVAEDSSGTPGAALETFSSIAAPTTGSNFIGTILTADSVTHPSLVAGTAYWLELQPHDPTTSGIGGWNSSSPSVFGNTAGRHDPNGSWLGVIQPQPAFEIRGTATAAPEPASLTLAGIGVAGLLGYAGRRRART
jgi:hypothetical protein